MGSLKLSCRILGSQGGSDRRAGRRYRGSVYIRTETKEGRFSMLHGISLYVIL
jgi:hypothetical protein